MDNPLQDSDTPEQKNAGAALMRLVEDELESGKAALAEGMHRIADALRSTMAGEGAALPLIDQAVDLLQDAADTVGERSVGEIGAMLTGFARRNPLLVLAGFALAGLAAGRIVTRRDGGVASAPPATHPPPPLFEGPGYPVSPQTQAQAAEDVGAI